MPKCGTTSLHNAFLSAGLISVHWALDVGKDSGADKRLRDYKEALNLRNCLSMDSLGTYSWILKQDRKNRESLGKIPDFEELFSRRIISDTLMNTG